MENERGLGNICSGKSVFAESPVPMMQVRGDWGIFFHKKLKWKYSPVAQLVEQVAVK